MKTVYILFILLIGVTGCSSGLSDDYTDSLTIGTGLGHGTVTGAADMFAIPSGSSGILLDWAFESRYNIGGFLLTLLIEQNMNGSFVERKLVDYNLVDGTDVHYLIDSFYHDLGIGRFRATMFVGIRNVVSKEYSVSY